ncbi:MAG: DUF4954 family protein [Planctomycetota bacterium]|jgi:hypothetical protein
MKKEKTYRDLTQETIKTLESNGCSCTDWSLVKVADGFDAASVRNAYFQGDVRIGDLSGTIKDINGIEKPCGIYNAAIINCTIGDRVRIANVGVHIANYCLADEVCIENVGTLQTNAGATFGNGVEIDVLNEAGGREVVLFEQLNAQFAYMKCLHRYRPKLIEKLNEIANKFAQSVKSDQGTIAGGAKISSVKEMVDIKIGSYASVNGAISLVNGSILSSKDAPTSVGADVVAEDFIIGESSSVAGGAILERVFVGQGCQIGKQYSATHSLFFANCEGFHGEACSIFAGPYTVTHHKSTLLIGGLFSFYNAGSGTNQSNHMYKLGPVHEGKLLRGTKTGSFSYVMWPCVAGPFSVVLGKHTGTFDTSDYPFSHLEAKSDGRCIMIPGLHLNTVGTVRDGAKWPKRDRRKGSVKRDIISFDVFSPYTIGKMIKANAELTKLHKATQRSIEEVSVGGAAVKRPILRSSQKYYRRAISMYLREKIVAQTEQFIAKGSADIASAFAVDADAVFSQAWVDIAGQLMPQGRICQLEDAIESGQVSTVEEFYDHLQKINESYAQDEWLWITKMYKEVYGVDLSKATKADIIAAADELLKDKTMFLKLVIGDAQKEFSGPSLCGFGQDGSDEDLQKDFDQVQGLYEENEFVCQMKNAVEQLTQRIEKFKSELSKL